MKEELLRFFNRYQIFIFPVFSALLSIFLLLLVIVPQLVSYIHTTVQIRNLDNKTNLLNQKADQLKKIDTNLYRSNLEVALITLPQEKDLPATIGQIQTLLTNNQLQLINMTFLSSPDTSQPSYSVRVDMSGTTSSLQAFLSQLKNAPQIMQLNSLDEALSKNGINQFEVTIQTYYSPLPSSIGSIEQPLESLSAKDADLLTKLQARSQTLPVISSSNLSIARGKSNPFQ